MGLPGQIGLLGAEERSESVSGEGGLSGWVGVVRVVGIGLRSRGLGGAEEREESVSEWGGLAGAEERSESVSE